MVQNQGQGYQGSYQPRPPIVCYRCQKPGHISRNCDAPRVASVAVEPVSPANPFQVGAMHSSTKKRSRHQTQSGAGKRENTTRFCLQMRLRGREIRPVLDSGSQKTTVHVDLLRWIGM